MQTNYVPIPSDPTVYQLIDLTHAQAGVDYLFCLPANLIRANEEGWAPVPGAPYYLFANRPCTLLYSGEPIPGTDVYTTVPEFFCDPDLTPLDPPTAPPTGKTLPPPPTRKS